MDAMAEISDKAAQAEEQSAAQPLLDVEAAIGRMLGSRSLYVSMLDMFRSQLMIDMEQVQDAIGQGNQREALRLIHSTKGAAKILGAEQLGGLSDTAYEAVQAGEIERQSEALAALLHGAAQTLTAVDDFLRSSSG